MKQLLNNPLFVGALGAAAIGVAAWNIVLPMYGGGVSIDTESIPSIGDPLDAIVGFAVQANAKRSTQAPGGGKTADLSTIGWNQNPLRDPFRLKTDNNNEPIDIDTELKKHAAASADEPTVEDVNINALVIGKSFKLAVVDGQLITEGNEVANAIVGAVTPDAIQIVTDDGKTRTVSMGDGP